MESSNWIDLMLLPLMKISSHFEKVSPYGDVMTTFVNFTFMKESIPSSTPS